MLNMNMKEINMFETCARKELCKAENPKCDNNMCLGMIDNGIPCECYNTIRIINDASKK